jgi:pyochelin synthetase
MENAGINERIASLSPEKRELLLRKLKEKQGVRSDKVNLKLTFNADRENLHRPFPLIEVQQVYWIGQLGIFDLSTHSSNIYVELKISNLNSITYKIFRKRMDKALGRLIKHHDILRLTILPDGMQKILENVPEYKIRFIDLRRLTREDIEKELESTRTRMRQSQTEVNKWPLFEFLGHYIKDGNLIVQIKINSLLMDGKSLVKFLYEYAQLIINPSMPLVKSEFSYRDYVLSWESVRDTEVYMRAKNYWLERISEMQTGPMLPYKYFVEPETNLAFKVEDYLLFDEETWIKFKTQASQVGLSPSSILLAKYLDVIAFWSYTTRFSIGVINTYRPPFHEQISNIMGNFNTVEVVCADVLNGNFIERAKGIQGQVIDSIDNPYFSGLHVLREINRIQGKSSKVAVPVFFNSLINYENPENPLGKKEKSEVYDRKSIRNLSVKEKITLLKDEGMKNLKRFLEFLVPFPQSQISEMNIYPSQMQILPTIYEEENGEIRCKWAGVTEIFPDGMMLKMFNCYKKALIRLAENKSSWEEKWSQWVLAFQETEECCDFPGCEVVKFEAMPDSIIGRVASQYGEKTAIVSSVKSLTYSDLYRISSQIGHKLHLEGIQTGSKVAVIMENGWEQIAAVFGIFCAGAAYISCDWMNEEECYLNDLLRINKIQAVLTQSSFRSKLDLPDNIRSICIDEINLNELSKEPISFVKKPDNTACMIYSGDAEGIKNKVEVNYRDLVSMILGINKELAVKAEDKVLSLHPVTSDTWLYDVFGMLFSGGTVVLADNPGDLDMQECFMLTQREQVTIWNSPVHIIENLISVWEGQSANAELSIRLIILSKGRANYRLSERIRNIKENIKTAHLWGCDEIIFWSMIKWLDINESDKGTALFNRNINGHSVYIMNKGMGRCPEWVPGNIYVSTGSDGQSKNMDSHIEDGMNHIHYNSMESMVKTKYIGRYCEQGNIEILGLEDDFSVNLKGYGVSVLKVAEEIEKCPGVRLAEVKLQEEPMCKEYLIAYVLTNEDTSIDAKEIRDFLIGRLPYYAVPKDIIILHSLKITHAGYVDWGGLSERPDIPCPVPKAKISPRNEIEEKLKTIFEDSLKIKDIGIGEDFFDLHGNSLNVYQTIISIEKKFGLRLKPAEFFDEPTIEHLAVLIKEKLSGPNSEKRRKSDQNLSLN